MLAEPLTAAEQRILKLLPTSTYLQMAATLYISRNTVKTHLRSIYQKLAWPHAPRPSSGRSICACSEPPRAVITLGWVTPWAAGLEQYLRAVWNTAGGRPVTVSRQGMSHGGSS